MGPALFFGHTHMTCRSTWARDPTRTTQVAAVTMPILNPLNHMGTLVQLIFKILWGVPTVASGLMIQFGSVESQVQWVKDPALP